MFRRILYISALLPLLILSLLPTPLLAVGLGVTPGKLDFTVHAGGTESQTLTVLNQSDHDAEFQVYVEGGDVDWLTVTPNEFTLSPAQSHGIEIAVAPPLLARGEHEFSLCVVSLAPESDLRIGAGIKVPVHIQVINFSPVITWGGIGAILLLTLLTGFLLWQRRRVRHA